jgi:myo-inositol-1(or 4)-monophosphatase
MPSSEDLAFVVELARSAGATALTRFGSIERRTKTSAGEAILGWSGAETVTDADRACQRMIVVALRRRFPADGIIGEESDDGGGITNLAPISGERVWVIDPIDGTNNYVAGFEAFAICIGLLDHGRPVLGVVHDPCRGRTYSAAAGAGAWVDRRRVRALGSPLGDQALIMLTCNLLDRHGQLPAFITRWLASSSWKFRMLGSAALEACQVGAGIAYGALTVNGKLWDVAAPAAFILEAGGVVSDLRGQDLFPFDLRGYRGSKVPFLAAGQAAHTELLRDISAFGWPPRA